MAGTPPFTKADKSEYYYKMIAGNRWDLFWKIHEKSKPSGSKFFSPAFKDLMSYMLAFKPAERLSIEELKQHPWFKEGDVPSKSEIFEEFKNRYQINQEEETKERAQKQLEKKHPGTYASRRGTGDDKHVPFVL
jgi:serine/threonine protein kinase